MPIKHGDTGQPFVEFGGSLQSNVRNYFGPVNINRLRIRLMDDKGNIVRKCQLCNSGTLSLKYQNATSKIEVFLLAVVLDTKFGEILNIPYARHLFSLPHFSLWFIL